MILTLGEKLKDERTSRKWTIKQVHNMLNDQFNYNLSEGKLSKLENDSLKYSSYDGIAYLAKLYNVSTDYLLGLTDIKTADPTIQNAVAYTGLTESAVEKLHAAIESNPYMALFLSFLIDSAAATVEEYQIPAIYRSLSFAIWEKFIAYPKEIRHNVIDNTPFFNRNVDVIGEITDQRSAIDTDIYSAAVFQQLGVFLDKLRDKEHSDDHSQYFEKFIDTVKSYEGGGRNG